MKSSSDKSTSQFIRYLLVGGFNTAFGYGLFALLNWLFRGLGSFSYTYGVVSSQCCRDHGSISGLQVVRVPYAWQLHKRVDTLP